MAPPAGQPPANFHLNTSAAGAGAGLAGVGMVGTMVIGAVGAGAVGAGAMVVGAAGAVGTGPAQPTISTGITRIAIRIILTNKVNSFLFITLTSFKRFIGEFLNISLLCDTTSFHSGSAILLI